MSARFSSSTARKRTSPSISGSARTQRGASAQATWASRILTCGRTPSSTCRRPRGSPAGCSTTSASTIATSRSSTSDAARAECCSVASHYPFQQIIGVEISPELAEIARVNAERYQPSSRRVAAIEVRNIDATTADYPDSNLLVHLYHPFQTPITEQVLSRLEAAYEAQPRRIDVAYLLYSSATTPVKDVFSRFGWLREVRHEQSVLGHYDWLLYSTEARVRRHA